MSRHEADREDLLREATALIERVELAIPACPERVVAGFRRDGSASFYFGADPVYQFNSSGHLRRAFVAGRLIKADQGRLAALDRRRNDRQVELQRSDLTDAEATVLLTDAAIWLDELRAALDGRSYTLIGQVPEGIDILSRVSAWLRGHTASIQIATKPHAR